MLSVVVHPADVQDRDGARQVLRTARRLFPFIERIFADAGYQGSKMEKVVADTGRWTLQIVKRSDAHHFVVLPAAMAKIRVPLTPERQLLRSRSSNIAARPR